MKNAYEMRLRDILDVLRRRWRTVLWSSCVGLAAGAIASLLLPMYRSSATVTMDKVPPMVELSPPGFVGHSTEVPATAFAIEETGVSGLAELAKTATMQDSASARLAPTLGYGTARAALARLRVRPVGQTSLLQITVEHRNPDVAVAAATAVTNTLIDLDLQARRRRVTAQRQAIEQQLAAAIPRLQSSENDLTVFKSKHGDAEMADRTTVSLTRLALLESQLADVRMQQQEARARIESTRMHLAKQARVVPTRWVPSPLITTLENQLAAEEIELYGMRQQFTPKYPALASVEAKVQATKRRLDVELGHSMQADAYGLDPVYQQLIQQLRQDEVAIAAADARGHALTDAIKAYDELIRQLPARELEQVRLARAVKQAEQITQILTEKLQQARITETSVGSAVRVVDAARRPDAPVRPRWFGLVLGAVVGLAAGFGGMFAKERVHDPLKSPEDLESLLKIPVLASVPRLKARDEGLDRADGRPHLMTSALWYLFPGRRSSRALIDAQRRRSRFAEAFRYLRTNLLSAPTGSVRTLLVTSPGLGEGKNTVAANLAITLAHAGRRVWLVEGDLREPALDRVCAFQDPTSATRSGLAQLLDGDACAASLLRHTAVDNLWVLPAGDRRTNPSERLARDRMRSLLTTRQKGVDIVIVVAPPILPVPDAAILAPLVDGVILVVNVGVTPREAAWRAQQQLRSVGARVLGAVVTGVPIGGPGAYDNYYASYYRAEPCTAWHFGPYLEGETALPSAGAHTAHASSAASGEGTTTSAG
jgi:polysaccharide biosynthesis transport protein